MTTRQIKQSDLDSRTDDIDVNDKYQFLKQIGKGSYGEVWLVVPLRPSSASKSGNKQYVLKRLDLRQSQEAPVNDIEVAEHEAKLLSTLKHPNIVAYTESFRSSDGFLNIVMAYCEGGDLYTKLKARKANRDPLPENQIIEWFIQITMALQYMHDKNILHRDLKTQNIFLTKNEIVKVGDLGIARVLESGNLATTIIGTPYYMSPEIFSHRPYGQKSDIWALGCCVYEMTTLEHAFNAKDMNSLMLKIIRGQTPQTSTRYSNELTSLIKSMLSKNPDDRPTAKKILQNPFIQNHIMKLVEKTKIKCQNQSNGHSQITVVKPTVKPSSSSAPIDVSSSNRTTDAKEPVTSASSPASKKTSASVNSRSAPILPSYPPLPPSQHRRPSNQGVLPPTAGPLPPADVNRSAASSVDSTSSNDARARRRLRARQSNPHPPTPIDEEQIDMKFFVKISQNDTLQRFKRDQLMNNRPKQHQPVVSSEDEPDVSPRQVPISSAHSSPVPRSSHQTNRPDSAASSFELDHSKYPADDESIYSEREWNPKNDRPQSESRVRKSYDSSPSSSRARLRRRENRMQSSVETAAQDASSGLSRSTSQDSVVAEVEKKKEGEKEMNDFLLMLTATLKVGAIPLNSVDQSEIDRNEFTNGSSSSERTLVENGGSPLRSHDDESVSQSRFLSTEGTMESPLYQTNRLVQRCQKLKEACLREISPEQLERALKLIDHVSDAQISTEMINILGPSLYNKYSAEIFVLKFYEQNLHSNG